MDMHIQCFDAAVGSVTCQLGVTWGVQIYCKVEIRKV